jgi:hypothetical protein
VQLFSPPLLKHVLVCIGMSIGGLFAFWAVTTSGLVLLRGHLLEAIDAQVHPHPREGVLDRDGDARLA